MRTLVSVLMLFVGWAIVPAQDQRKIVFWSGDSSCGHKKAITEPDLLRCDTVQTDRGPVSTVTLNGMRLAVAFLDDKEYSIVAVHITNSTADFIPFDSDLWGAAHFRSRTGFHAGERPIIAETALPSRDIVRGMASDTRLGKSLGTFIADGQRTSETKEIRRADGTRYKVDVIVPDKDAQQAAARDGAARSELLTNEQRRIRSTALTAKSIPAGGSVKGLVYFRRVKKAEYVLFSIGVGDTTFFFQLPKDKK